MPKRSTASRRNSIHFQLFWLVIVVTTFALAVSMLAGVILDWRKQQEQLEHSLVTTARAIGIASSAAISFRDAKAAGEALRILAAQKEVVAAAVYTIDGDRLATYGGEADLPSAADRRKAHLPRLGLFSSSATIFQPVELDGWDIGYAYLRVSLNDYRRTQLLHAAFAIGANLLGLLLAIGLGIRFIGRIAEPLKALADTSAKVRENRDFSHRAVSSGAKEPSCNEISQLIENFNAMLAEIELLEHERVDYHNRLELTVQQRTEALSVANRELQTAKEVADALTVTKSRFLSAASHDLRQPIQAINLFYGALSNTALNEDQRRICNFLSLSIQNLGEILDALLDISRLDSGTVTASAGIVDVFGLFSNIDAEFSAAAAAKWLRFSLYFPTDDLRLMTDGDLLHSLLRNLIGNAIKYTGQGGVLVALRRRGDQALIQVWDSGIGIAPENLATIFDEYFQVANPERDKDKGLGLGLSIAKRIARLLNTEIVCRSRPGKGSVFEFLLPFADNSPREVSRPIRIEPERAAQSLNLAGSRVLVVEDDSMVATAMQVSLAAIGMIPTVHGSAEQALADVEIASYDYYICDFQLPGANGIELLGKIRTLRAGTVKAVLLTGETSPDRIEDMQSHGWPVLFKPVDLSPLVSALERTSR